jgi:hypothetical protein
MKKHIIILALIGMLIPCLMKAETVYLKDKTTVSGKLSGLEKDKFAIITNDGKERSIDKGSVEKIVFDEVAEPATKSPQISVAQNKPDPDFSSPKKTFLAWRKAAVDGNLERMATCFLSAAKDDQLAELKSYSKDRIKEMSKETKKTDFSFSEPLFDQDRAYLSVTRKIGAYQRSEVIQFQKEGENWKMLPE